MIIVATSCPSIHPITNAKDIEYDDVILKKTNSVSIICQDGFWITPGVFSVEVMCLPNSTWTNVPSKCIGIYKK